jgi:hypothetical protein
VFRRVGGQVQVAIFVYRVKRSSLNAPSWRPQPVVSDGSEASIPVPWTLDLNDASLPFGPWAVGMVGRSHENDGDPDDALPGADAGDAFLVDHPDYGWQAPNQWLLDQYGTLHRVASGRVRKEDRTPVSLSTPVPSPVVSVGLDRLDLDNDRVRVDPQFFTASSILPPMALSEMSRPYDFRTGLVDPTSLAPVVDRLWYIPPHVETEDGLTYELIPVYVTVANL